MFECPFSDLGRSGTERLFKKELKIVININEP